MAITSQTQHRRNSGVLLANAAHLSYPPPPLYPLIASPLNDGPNLKSKPTKRVPRKAAGGTTTKAAFVAVKPADPAATNSGSPDVKFTPGEDPERPLFTPSFGFPPLLTPTSRFPSRTLPPLRVRASNLDGPGAKVFKVGEKVRVRRLSISGPKQSSWSKWARGQVVRYEPMRAYAGSYGHAYRVAVGPFGNRVVEDNYAQFMGEICLDDNEDHDEDFLTAEEGYMRRRKANWVYVPIQSSHEAIWTPAEVLSWDEKSGRILVSLLAGPTAGRVLNVTEVLPYTWETAIACRKQGQKVFCSGQELFLQDIPVRPLDMADDSPASLPSTFDFAVPV